MYRNSKSYGERKYPGIEVIECGPRLRLGVEATPFEQACGLQALQNTLYRREDEAEAAGNPVAAGEFAVEGDLIGADLEFLCFVHDVDRHAVHVAVMAESEGK